MATIAMKKGSQTGAELLVKSLESQGVEYVLGIPGAKIDKVFDTLSDSKIKTVVCRHEQNAAFIAGGIGRLTGKAGVTLVTSGPGCSNLATGLAAATSEGDPVVGVDPTVVSPGAISITAVPIAYSCRDRIGHTDSRVPKSAGSAQRSRGVSASLANAAAPVVSESSTC